MGSTPRERRSAGGVRHWRRLAVTSGLTAVLSLAVVLATYALPEPRTVPPRAGAGPAAASAPASVVATEVPSMVAKASPGPSRMPARLTAAQALLATAKDPQACAVSFSAAGVSARPELQTQGRLYRSLPIPRRAGAMFAGWYPSRRAAAAQAVTSRVNGADVVACPHRQVTLYGAWTTPAANAAQQVRVPILMYHWFTPKPGGEGGWLRQDYVFTGRFDAEMAYLAGHHFYLPTWDELSAFIDGRLALPHDSVIITDDDDDADPSWFQLGVPVIDKYRLLSTSFVITKYRSAPSPSIWVLQRSHTDDMHDAGANGRGKMVNYSAAQIAADMEASAKILGAKEVMAYPFGDYDDTAKQGLREAGFGMARTTHYGYVVAGTDKLALPCVRISFDTSLDQFVADVS